MNKSNAKNSSSRQASQKPIVIILLGPPGSGKGTQANLLAEYFNLYCLETSKIGEEKIKQAKKEDFIVIKGKKYYLQEERKKWEKGELWDPFFAAYLIKKEIENLARQKTGIVFQGSPRTVEEAKEIIPFLEKYYQKSNIKIFLLEQNVEESIWRNSHRRICQLLHHPILYHKETEKLTICPLDGSKLIKRKLDKPAIIKKRFLVYQKQTLPLIDYFKKQGFKVFKIDASQSVAEVFSDILKKLK